MPRPSSATPLGVGAQIVVVASLAALDVVPVLLAAPPPRPPGPRPSAATPLGVGAQIVVVASLAALGVVQVLLAPLHIGRVGELAAVLLRHVERRDLRVVQVEGGALGADPRERAAGGSLAG